MPTYNQSVFKNTFCHPKKDDRNEGRESGKSSILVLLELIPWNKNQKQRRKWSHQLTHHHPGASDKIWGLWSVFRVITRIRWKTQTECCASFTNVLPVVGLPHPRVRLCSPHTSCVTFWRLTSLYCKMGMVTVHGLLLGGHLRMTGVNTGKASGTTQG